MIDWLTDTLIATTVLLLLVLLIRRPIARHFGAGMAYALWLLPAARLFMPSLEKVIPASEPVGAEIVTLPVVVQDALTVKAAALAAEPAFDWAQPLLALWLGGAALLFIVQMIRYCLMRDELLSLKATASPGRSPLVCSGDLSRCRSTLHRLLIPANANWLWRMNWHTTARVTYMPIWRRSPSCASTGSIRWHGWHGMPSGWIRKPPAMPAFLPGAMPVPKKATAARLPARQSRRPARLRQPLPWR